jgi:hypothetical protein
MSTLQIDGRPIATLENHNLHAGDVVEMAGVSGKPRPFRLAYASRSTFTCTELTRRERIMWRLQCIAARVRIAIMRRFQ